LESNKLDLNKKRKMMMIVSLKAVRVMKKMKKTSLLSFPM
jgi:hypothetical protein